MMNVIVELEEQKLHQVFGNASPVFFRQAGAYLRRAAMNNIKKRKNSNRHSAPGKPPFYHGATFGGLTFKQSIMFKATKDSVLIGAIAGPLGAMAAVHEFGGKQWVRCIDSPNFGRVFNVGEVGPVSTKKLKNYTGKTSGYKDPLTGFPVVKIVLPTQRMAAHSTRLMKRILYGYKHFWKKKQVPYPARPFMQPAYNASEPYLLKIWKDLL